MRINISLRTYHWQLSRACNAVMIWETFQLNLVLIWLGGSTANRRLNTWYLVRIFRSGMPTIFNLLHYPGHLLNHLNVSPLDCTVSMCQLLFVA